jgi:hypothetical protein
MLNLARIGSVLGSINEHNEYSFNEDYNRSKKAEEHRRKRDNISTYSASQTNNIFKNNHLYYNQCRELEKKLSHLSKINEFLIDQVTQSVPSLPPKNQKRRKKVLTTLNQFKGFTTANYEQDLQSRAPQKTDLQSLFDIIKFLMTDHYQTCSIFEEYLSSLTTAAEDPIEFLSDPKNLNKSVVKLFLVIIKLVITVYHGSDAYDAGNKNPDPVWSKNDSHTPL